MIRKLLAQDWVGTITPPFNSGSYDQAGAGIEGFINRGFTLVFAGFGLYALLNFIMAAYNYINSQGEAKNIEKAQKLVINSLIGLFLLATTFLIAGVIGAVFFGSWDYLLNLNDLLGSIAP